CPKAISGATVCLQKWCEKASISVNIAKTKIMVFRKGGRLPQALLNFTYAGEPIEIVNQYEYLGITLQPTLTFTAHLSRMKAKCSSAMAPIRNLANVSIETAVKVYSCKIQPILLYNLATYAKFLSPTHLSLLDIPKSMFMKKCMCLHSSTSSTFVLLMAKQPTQ